MLPVLPPGTLVLGFRHFRKLRPGMVLVIVHDGKEKIRRLEKIENDELFVVGDHPDSGLDSHDFGLIPYRSVRARIVWPRTKKV